MDNKEDADLQNELSEYLPIYYRRLFPFKLFYRWLSYGNVNTFYFCNREFSFTYDKEIFIRYRSFRTCGEFEKEVKDKCPNKIDIGAVFNGEPKDHKTVSEFKAEERELVFDIDLTDYDEIRYCCSEANICPKCWKFMVVTIEIVNTVLKEDYGFRNLLWVYSGRRGVHCWVCDESARTLSMVARRAVAQYLSIVVGGANSRKKINYYELKHAAIKRASRIVEKYFTDIQLHDQDFLKDKSRWTKVLSLIPDESLRSKIDKEMESCSTSTERWDVIVNTIDAAAQTKKGLSNVVEGIKLYFCYPRFDVNVTCGLNHLLKSPFCVHPKTGRICIPIDIDNLATFNPFTVPNIKKLIDEINIHDAVYKEAIVTSDNAALKKVKDYKKTSLNQSVQVFKDFIKNLEKTWAGKHLAKSDEKCEF